MILVLVWIALLVNVYEIDAQGFCNCHNDADCKGPQKYVCFGGVCITSPTGEPKCMPVKICPCRRLQRQEQQPTNCTSNHWCNEVACNNQCMWSGRHGQCVLLSDTQCGCECRE